MFSEFNPPNWQPASSTMPEPMATVRLVARPTLILNGFRVTLRLPVVAERPAPRLVAGRPRPGAGRERRELAVVHQALVPAAVLPDRACTAVPVAVDPEPGSAAGITN